MTRRFPTEEVLAIAAVVAIVSGLVTARRRESARFRAAEAALGAVRTVRADAAIAARRGEGWSVERQRHRLAAADGTSQTLVAVVLETDDPGIGQLVVSVLGPGKELVRTSFGRWYLVEGAAPTP